jgi:predicted Zn finger-like uncharacterized protein
MFTVCPKCALTLVVTAADLRVAQGYVRCGRCSNVFNALARLSEDRNAAAAAAASQGVPPSSTGVHPRPQPTAVPSPPPQPSLTSARPPQTTGPSSSFTFTKPPDVPAPAARAPKQPATPPVRPQQPAAAPPSRFAPPPPPLDLDDDDAIPEGALEFNPDAADVNQVFVEPPPNPEWTAATGTFKAIVLKSEEAIHGPAPAKAVTPAPVTPAPSAPPAANKPASGANPSGSNSIELSSSFGEDEFELDPDFLSATAEMRKLKTGLADAEIDLGDFTPSPFGAQPPPPAQTPAPTPAPPSAKLAPRGPLPATPPQISFRPPPTETPTQSPFRGLSTETPFQTPFRAPPTEAPPQHQFHAGAETPTHPRSPVSDAQPPARAPAAETQSRQQLKTPPAAPLDTDSFFEPQVVSSRPPTRTAAVKAFGLDAVAEPPAERLASLARSRVAPGAAELETAPSPTRMLPNLATLWSAGSGALVILLAAQIVNHYRNDLAATAQFNKPITALYAALGVHLTPRWDLHAYDVRQLGASVDSASAGQIMVRASVKNGAHQPQPMPLLRVTLQDRFGNRIAARDVPPGSYLPRATADTAFLPAGQRIDAEMAFVDPGTNAVGFEIDACLPAPAGGIACANDPVAR